MIWDEFLRHFRFCDEEDSGSRQEKLFGEIQNSFLAYDGGLDFFRFYALYSEEQAVNNPTRSANDICSFGLKGQALCHYTLDRKVEIIAVSPNDSVLYAIGNVIGQEESVYLFLYSL